MKRFGTALVSTALLTSSLTAMSTVSLAAFPEPTLSPASRAAITDAVSRNVKRLGAKGLVANSATQAISNYMAFLAIDPISNADIFKATLSDLLSSSTQFVICPDITDWACLEKAPVLTPGSAARVENPALKLGDPVQAGASLDLEYFFTARWNSSDPEHDPKIAAIPRVLAPTFADRILRDGRSSMDFAVYGIDDLAGSMKPVYDAIQSIDSQGSKIRAVIDQQEGAGANSFLRRYDASIVNGSVSITTPPSLLFSYVLPAGGDASHWILGRPDWMNQLMGASLLPIAPPTPPKDNSALDAQWFMNAPRRGADTMQNATAAVRVAFQYDGSEALIRLLNRTATQDSEARARLEFPSQGIMHNKFAILGGDSVWTGTTNIAQTCMGDEQNANMAVYIHNAAIAATFKKEFEEMWTFDPSLHATDGKGQYVNAQGGKELPVGHFHSKKTVNTPRYFVFDDKTEVSVHFSPTDDGEHRAILPMLLSAKQGDLIKVSMFGGGGLEYVRAFQLAASRGAKIQISLDSVTGSNGGGWIRDPKANLLDGKNPYDPSGASSANIEVRLSGWRGLNHHKTGVLLRNLGGGKYRAEEIILGSQNWSGEGNDTNDENMIAIRNRFQDVPAAAAFAKEFDEHIWKASTRRAADASSDPALVAANPGP